MRTPERPLNPSPKPRDSVRRELNPNDSDGLGFLAQALCLQGKPDEAIARISEAARINPGLRLERRAQTAMAHFVARRYAESIEAMEA